MDFYIQFFKCMVQQNMFSGSDLDKMCLQYCFGPLIQKDLFMTRKLWNEHRIRKQTAQNNIAGIPYILYNLPEKYGAVHYRKEVDKNTVKDLLTEMTTEPLGTKSYLSK